MSGVIQSVIVQAPESTVEEDAAALALAAQTAPTTEEEARAQIAAKKAADEAAKNAPPVAVRPDNVPEKFWDAAKGVVNHEAILASYAELEKKVGAPKVEGDEDADLDDLDPALQETEEAEDAEPFSLAVFDAEYAEAGALSEASYETLAAKGFDKATVDGYIAGQEALGQIATQRITEAAGGKDGMDRIFAWATTGVSPAEIDAFNEKFQHADVNAGVIAMEQLKAKYEAANGKDPVLLGGKPAGNPVDTFDSWAQVTAAMADPKYKSDPAYRAAISAKLGRSNKI
ncbi:hypothetical protein NKH16_20080 [Mesorhizobium sp. M1307]|uniref:capsid assembly protein n=1 Tax=Mesorhizobium sp. M1307 TaxID=2957079 RepID=UPI0033374F98